MWWVAEAKNDIRDLINLDFGNSLQTTHDATTLQIAK